MKTLGSWLLISAVTLAVLLLLAITLTIGWRPFLGPRARPLTQRTFERTPQRLERGRYIATALSGCSYCHSPHDWAAPGAPLNPGMEGAGEIDRPPLALEGERDASSRPISRRTRRQAPAVGRMTNSPAPSAKASVMMAAPCFR